jgi:hypothetical protein
VGRKIFFSIPLKMKAAELSDFVWVYAESKLSDEPQDAAIGFTDARKRGFRKNAGFF